MRVETPGLIHAAGETIARATELVQLEFRLARAELAEKALLVRAGLALILAGAVLLTVALFTLVQAIVVALVAAGLSPLAATLLVTVGLVAIGLGLVFAGRKQLAADALVPTRCLDGLNRDRVLVKEKLS